MPRKRSPETELRHLRAQLGIAEKTSRNRGEEMLYLRKELDKARMELSDWKTRCDRLIMAIGKKGGAT